MRSRMILALAFLFATEAGRAPASIVYDNLAATAPGFDPSGGYWLGEGGFGNLVQSFAFTVSSTSNARLSNVRLAGRGFDRIHFETDLGGLPGGLVGSAALAGFEESSPIASGGFLLFEPSGVVLQAGATYWITAATSRPWLSDALVYRNSRGDRGTRVLRTDQGFFAADWSATFAMRIEGDFTTSAPTSPLGFLFPPSIGIESVQTPEPATLRHLAIGLAVAVLAVRRRPFRQTKKPG